MKLEVIIINCTTQESIKTYSVPDFSMLDFQEWKALNEVVINLNHLSHAIANLDSKDSETGEPISNSREVDFYLPDPIKNRAISQFVESGTGTEEPSEPVLKSSTILSAVVTEILQNHHPHSDHKVRISDG
jgi:hypothetical protein